MARIKYRVLGICAGNGVCLYPFQRNKNFKVIGNIEPRAIFHSKGDKQWNMNFDSPILRKLEDLPKRPHIIIGHPDCGHSSQLSFSRAKKLSDPRENKSLNLFLDSIEKYQPRMFLMENLSKILDYISEDDFRQLFSGYEVTIYPKLSVSLFGNSQITRRRLILIGVKKGIETDFGVFRVNKPKNTGSLLGWLKRFPIDSEEALSLGHSREEPDEVISIYGKCRIKVSEITRSWNEERVGEKKWAIPGSKMKSAPGVYRNKGDEYPMTVRKGNREFNPEGLMMSPRERACIQGIPHSFGIYIERVQSKYWVNKGRASVTKCIPYEIGYWFMLQCIKTLLPDRFGYYEDKYLKSGKYDN